MVAVVHAGGHSAVEPVCAAADAFSPRVQAVPPFVVLDVSGMTRLFGGAAEVGEALMRAVPEARSVAVAPTVAGALVLAASSPGLQVADTVEALGMRLSSVPVEVLQAVFEARGASEGRGPGSGGRAGGHAGGQAGDVAGTGRAGDRLGRGSGAAGGAPASGPAAGAGQPGDGPGCASSTAQAPGAGAGSPAGGLSPSGGGASRGRTGRAGGGVLPALQRWGVSTLGALAALPPAQVRARLGDAGVAWQRLARGLDEAPLVPRVAAPVFERALELEWPIEGREPLAFVLARLLDPLALELERADRGAVCVRTTLHLTTRAVHVRALPLPAPLRDAKTLRTLVLLDLESHPPAAAIDRVHVRLDPTPARVLQHTLFEPAHPAPEQVATLIARLTAVMGEGRVGTPALADTWAPGAFRMQPFALEPLPVGPARMSSGQNVAARLEPLPVGPVPGRPSAYASGITSPGTCTGTSAVQPVPDLPIGFRRFRLPVPVRVRVHEGRPVHLICDRPGIAGGAIVQASGPWRTSGAWWQAPAVTDGQVPWDRDEWDIALADGTLYRLHVERAVGQWALDGLFD